jgi:integrase/recombinase XerC
MENGLAISNSTTAIMATPAAITEELGKQFIAYLDAKPQSVATYRASIRRMFEYMATAGVTAPTRADILAYRDDLKQNYKPATVSLHITAARLFFRWTAQQGIYPDIADHIKGAKLEQGFKKDYLTPDQVKAILSGIDHSTTAGKRDYAIMSLMITGGLRCIEVARADIEDIRTAGGCTVLFIQGKGKDDKGEYVKLSPAVEMAIRQYLNARGETNGKAPLFTSESNSSKDNRLTTRSISRLVKQRMQAAGYDSERLTAHSLRHTAATLNLLNGGTEKETQQLLRHKNINTTMIYSHDLERAKNNSENRIAAAIGL